MTSKTEKKIPRKQFLFLMTRLATAFRENISKDLFELYYEFLGDSNFQCLSEAVDTLIRDKKWFPKVAEFEEVLYPPVSTESQYMKYLERTTQRHLEDLKQLEHKADKSEAVKCLEKIAEMLNPKKIEPSLTGQEAEEFERKRRAAKEKVKRLLN